MTISLTEQPVVDEHDEFDLDVRVSELSASAEILACTDSCPCFTAPCQSTPTCMATF
ncbi:hypothetical protein GCM10010191_51790 [Actinomadura vinacea]|uniref:FxLD family lantipeptide n=1 Tax=Actinomadura vinacea TaxID=115336 RepID=A0ABN3JIR9_9ACTN